MRVFGWYNVFGFLPTALGAAAAGGVLGAALARGRRRRSQAQRRCCSAYAGAGAGAHGALRRAGRRGAASTSRVAPAVPGALGLGRSRAVVLQLAGLQGLDALAGGFIMQSLLAYWFHVRFGVGPEALGALFFGTNLLSALSFLAAARIAERVGLLNTMVFTHLPSNLLLLGVPFMPTFGGAAALLLARHVLSQMDVPTRQAFTVALVAPEERAAAAGLTVSVRALAQSAAPSVAGVAMGAAAGPAPFLLAGGLKIVYDLLPLLPLPLGAPRQAGARAGRAARWRRWARRRGSDRDAVPLRALRRRPGPLELPLQRRTELRRVDAHPRAVQLGAGRLRRLRLRPRAARARRRGQRRSATSRASTGRRSSSRRPGRGSTCASSSRGR